MNACRDTIRTLMSQLVSLLKIFFVGNKSLPNHLSGVIKVFFTIRKKGRLVSTVG